MLYLVDLLYFLYPLCTYYHSVIGTVGTVHFGKIILLQNSSPFYVLVQVNYQKYDLSILVNLKVMLKVSLILVILKVVLAKIPPFKLMCHW